MLLKKINHLLCGSSNQVVLKKQQHTQCFILYMINYIRHSLAFSQRQTRSINFTHFMLRLVTYNNGNDLIDCYL